MATVLLFALTYLLIASRRMRLLPIGRPAGAMLGAFGMVALGALTPEQSYAAIDHDTILLLFSMMALTAYVAEAGGFERLATAVLARCRTGLGLLIGLNLVAGALAALMVNDTVCVFLTPVVLTLCRRADLPFGPFLIALATGANLGSAATVVGNPQNMLIAGMGELSFGPFLALSGPVAVIGLILNSLLLYVFYGRELRAPLRARAEASAGPWRSDLRAVLLAVALVVLGFFLDLHLGYTALAGVMALMFFERREPSHVFAAVDWTLLVFFCCLFIVVAGFNTTGLPGQAWEALAPSLTLHSAGGVAAFTAAMGLGAQVVSNVPMVMLVGPHLSQGDPVAWVLLAFVLTVAGNLTLLGSVANIIVAESARDTYPLGFWEYARFGVPSTLLVCAVGVPVLMWLAG